MVSHGVLWSLETGEGPLVATAIHNGHDVREDLIELFALSDADRLREEDPFTGNWTAVAPTRLVAEHSRFEVDLNRPREKAVYQRPEDAWGLQVWKEELPNTQVEKSLAIYDGFYQEVHELLTQMVSRYRRVVVFDLHSYNHRRGSPGSEPAPVSENPEVNVGTGTMLRECWAPLVDRFIGDLRRFDYMGRHLDVRENIKFRGGNFPQWIHETFPDSVCALSIEFKKFFMDEWTGQPEEVELHAIQHALSSTVQGIHEELLRF